MAILTYYKHSILACENIFLYGVTGKNSGIFEKKHS
jgi:hypothetical protein